MDGMQPRAPHRRGSHWNIPPYTSWVILDEELQEANKIRLCHVSTLSLTHHLLGSGHVLLPTPLLVSEGLQEGMELRCAS